MALWFLRGIRKGIVTTRYPARPDASAGTLPTPPTFLPRRLTPGTAARLVDVCPSGALVLDGGDLVLDLGRCSACGRCVHAAQGAVRPSGVWELSATGRAQLVKRIPVEGARR
jgi:dissimilatory sulfite reductase (desulfoviridin) alpha/beta subunit